MQHIIINICVVVSILTWESGCQTLPKQNLSEDADPVREVLHLFDEFTVAHGGQFDVFAPLSFRDAETKLKMAQSLIERHASPHQTLQVVAEARGYLDRARQISATTKQKLGDVAIARSEVLRVKGDELSSDQLSDVDDELKSLTRIVETLPNYQPSKPAIDKLNVGYQKVLRTTIQKRDLVPIQQTIDRALTEGAEVKARRSLAQARTSLQNAVLFLESNMRDSIGVEAATIRARMDAEHLLKIIRIANRVQSGDPEQIALESEKQIKDRTMDKEAAARQAAASEQREPTGIQNVGPIR